MLPPPSEVSTYKLCGLTTQMTTNLTQLPLILSDRGRKHQALFTLALHEGEWSAARFGRSASKSCPLTGRHGRSVPHLCGSKARRSYQRSRSRSCMRYSANHISKTNIFSVILLASSNGVTQRTPQEVSS